MKKIIFVKFLTLIYLVSAIATEPPLLRGEIQALNDSDQVSINIGSEQGVLLGTIFEAYSENEVYTLPFTQETIVKKGEVVGRLRVTHVAPRFSRCEIIEPFISYLGQLVLGRPVPQVGNRPPLIEKLTSTPENAQWGHPLEIDIIGSDPEDQRVHLEAYADKGFLSISSHQKVFWFPPENPGETRLEIALNDGIGRSSTTLVVTHDSPSQPFFNTTAYKIYGADLLPYNQIDQLQVSPDGLIWILDNDLKSLICLGPSLTKLFEMSLQDIRPIRFSVNDKHIAILDEKKERVLIYTREGIPVGRIGQQGSEIHLWEKAVDILLLLDGNLVVLDKKRQTVVIYNIEGQFQACVGYPDNQPPGLLNASWLERHGKGFAIIDLDQHNRVIFNQNFQYQENLPLGNRLLPLSGLSGAKTPTYWPQDLPPDSVTELAYLSQDRWLAVDTSRQRLWRWDTTQKINEFIDGASHSGEQKLYRTPQGWIYWLQNRAQNLIAISPEGWKHKIPLPPSADQITDLDPQETIVWLDNKNCRVIYGSIRFGQKGKGTGMMKKPTEVLLWNNHIAVLDPGNEKVLIFNKEGLLVREQIFKNCLSFCLSSLKTLIILCEDGLTWSWNSLDSPPVSSQGSTGQKIKAFQGGFGIIQNYEIIITDLNFKTLQKLHFEENVEDAIQSTYGELWVITRKKLYRHTTR